ncbi:hypothetical protein [Virgibacillus sp. YIM 98842]|uniref:hypothetical protein n=1 Tax=Virgibacillus sp. YIM 98842 TaxID=2663533 RepID=UPI0013DA8A58|nr:hypothetical protein [Virgibacillus sp. YIM 98842]
MHHYHPPFNEERQFNLPGYLMGQLFGSGGNQFPWQSGPFPGGGSQFPWQQGGFPWQGGAQPSEIPPQQQAGAPPNTPPPPFVPQQSQFQTFAVDPGGIRGCLFRFTYIWATRDAFWFYPTFVGRNSIAGFRWQGNRWVYFGIDLNRIQSFQCF